MDSKKLSILIPYLERDWVNCERLMTELRHPEVEIYSYRNKGEHSIGHYRNELVEWVKTPYLCFLDADDSVSPNYIETLLKGIATSPDAISLRGVITIDGGSPEVFEHSIKYSEWKTTKNPIKYERFTNHLNVVKSDIAKQIKYPDIRHGEDRAYSDSLRLSGLVKNEYYTDEILYFYKYISNK